MAAALVVLLVVSLSSFALLQNLSRTQRQASRNRWQIQSQCLAEAGVERAQARLLRDQAYRGERWTIAADASASRSEDGEVEIQVALSDESSAATITVKAKFPAARPDAALSTLQTTIKLSVKGKSS
jgi:Tfp pilus assembly protein PilV